MDETYCWFYGTTFDDWFSLRVWFLFDPEDTPEVEISTVFILMIFPFCLYQITYDDVAAAAADDDDDDEIDEEEEGEREEL